MTEAPVVRERIARDIAASIFDVTWASLTDLQRRKVWAATDNAMNKGDGR